MATLKDLLHLIGRIFMAGLFVYDGVVMIRDPEGTTDYMEAFGIPGFTLPLAILLQLGGGIAVVLGWQTRKLALAFAGFTLVTALVFHTNFGDQNQVLHFGKDIAICGGFLFLALAGAGRFALSPQS